MFVRLLWFLFVIIYTPSIYAQEEEQSVDQLSLQIHERQINVNEFINLKVYSGIEVKLIPAEENKLLILGEDRMDVVAKIKGQINLITELALSRKKENLRWYLKQNIGVL